jgi:hypothetical protein
MGLERCKVPGWVLDVVLREVGCLLGRGVRNKPNQLLRAQTRKLLVFLIDCPCMGLNIVTWPNINDS